ncbi:MAG: carboxy terminal-processing peptidase [Crocinitomicaceae bacterium]|nr:carboxy terminal-processing peptidase [Crocinitomicaceae bacterium]
MISNKKYFFLFAAACILLVAFSKPLPPDDIGNRESLLMEAVMQTIVYNHYNPMPVDNELSEKVYDSYIKRVDNGKRFFLQSDIDAFSKHRLELDDYAKAHDFDFLDELNRVHASRVELAREYYNEILSKPFDFSKEETIETDVDKLGYVKSEEELHARWRSLLKYNVLIELDSKLQRQEKAQEDKDTNVVIKSFEELEIAARGKVLKDYDRWFKRIMDSDRDDNLSMYINTFANVIEPHTSYFAPKDKENFDIRMSGKLEGIGAQLTPQDGFIKVTRIVPGSASWKQGELEVDDLILKVAQGDEEPVDIEDMPSDDVVQMIRGKKGTEVQLTVKKKSGQIIIIPIIRDIVVLEESYAKSAVIEDVEDDEKIGIVDLRTFYADFQDPSGRRCSRDVKNEVENLIADNVEGIIIDLRFNGGGSLMDAVDMTGLFIDQGPVVQVKQKTGAPRSLNDVNPGTLYDGPLVILVNSYSASASEIMAAALQDYGRAVIIGTSPSTFGKGTVQRFYELDKMVPERYAKLGQLGNVKVTTQKFFRINGGSTQLRGVTPDIVLPGLYSYIETGETKEEYPLPWTEIEPSTYESTPLKKMSAIKKKSAARIQSNEALSIIDERAQWIKEQESNTEVSLNLKKYQTRQEASRKKSEEYEALVSENERLNILYNGADTEEFLSDTTKLGSMRRWTKTLKKDPYIMEAVEVLGDMNLSFPSSEPR